MGIGEYWLVDARKPPLKFDAKLAPAMSPLLKVSEKSAPSLLAVWAMAAAGSRVVAQRKRIAPPFAPPMPFKYASRTLKRSRLVNEHYRDVITHRITKRACMTNQA